MLFKRAKQTNIKRTISPEKAAEIYAKLEAEESLAGENVFEIDMVQKEAKRIETKAYSLLSEETTLKSLKIEISSEILSIDTLVNDVVKWSKGEPEKAPTWEEFKAEQVEPINIEK